jgi:hypothetical protein
MPVDGLKGLPVSLRVRMVRIGATTFEYEEYPKKGDKTGTMKIFRNGGLADEFRPGDRYDEDAFAQGRSLPGGRSLS